MIQTPCKARRTPSPEAEIGTVSRPDLGEIVAQWGAVAERFLSAWWRALTDGVVVDIDPATTLDLSQALPTEALRNLAKILAACAERGAMPTLDLILAVANGADMPVTWHGGDDRAALRAILERESSAAGLSSYVAWLNTAARKGAQVRRIYRRLRGLIEGLDSAAVDPLNHTRSIRKQKLVIRRAAFRPARGKAVKHVQG
jgi:hypothetical protein